MPLSAQMPPKWSAAAISGFVLSLLGCLGITALLGLVLGIVGILRTGGGQRRGRGLAIAAIPISLVMGVLSLSIAFSAYMAMQAKDVLEQVPTVLAADSAGTMAAASALRQLATTGFNDDVGDAALEAWLKQVAEKHGRLAQPPQLSRVQPPAQPDQKTRAINFEGKFINGTASVSITFDSSDWEVKIDDIAVDGVSPRDTD
jgi:hypothetical protein